MSKLKVDQIRARLRALFEPHLSLSDIGAADTERESKILSRCLAAFGIYHSTGCTAKEAAEAVWDGADDNGIDSAYFDAATATVVLAQAKFIQKGTGEPEAAEVGTFLHGVRDLVEQDGCNFHNRLQQQVNDVFQRIETPGTSLKVILISTGASTLARHARTQLDGLMRELNGSDPDPIASFEVFGLKEVYNALAADSIPGGISVEGTILEWSTITNPYRAYFGMIDGGTLKAWWVTNGRRLVSANIRHALGATDVNTEIKKTASNEPANFWYFNNGITLICDEAVKAPANAASRSAGVFGFKGASIVNGAQTVSTLGSVDDDAKLADVRVPIRAIVLKNAPPNFGQQVTRSNNLQNRIEERDFVSQDPVQERLRKEMSMEGVDYQYVRGIALTSSPNTLELIELTIALACAHGDKYAVDVKTGISRFFKDLTKAPYKAIFNDHLSGAKAFNTVLIQREIDKWIEQKKRSITKKRGAPWGVLVHGNRILSAAAFFRLSVSLEQPIKDFQSGLSDLAVANEIQQAYERIITRVESQHPNRFLAVLFKNPSDSKDVFDYATS
ncbi:AIPR family protein [Myxococcota bacterium]|nr:AIPR family protein [Myxococcota bacterium]MBU1899805.1 AIPR family protein [Myxococcota bacterium]